MTRTRLRPELRRTRFDEAEDVWQARRLRQEEAAGCSWSVRSWVGRDEGEGLDAMVSTRAENDLAQHENVGQLHQPDTSESGAAVARTALPFQSGRCR